MVCPICEGAGEHSYPGKRQEVKCCFCGGYGEIRNKIIRGTRI